MSFSRDVFSSFVWRAGTILLNFVIGIIIARCLGAEERGMYAIVTLTIVLISILGNFGVPDALIYLIGKKKYPIEHILVSGLIYSTITGIIFSILAVVLIQSPLKNLFSSASIEIYYIAFLAIIPQMISAQIRHSILGLKKVNKYNQLLTIEVLFLLISMFVLVWLMDLKIEGAIIAYGIASILSFFIHLIYLKSELTRWAIGFFNFGILKEALKLGSNFFLTGIGGFGVQRTNYIFLEVFHSSSSVGLFSVAGSLPNLFAIIPSQIALILYPWIASSTNEHDKVKLSATVIRHTLFLGILVTIPFLFIMKPLIIFLYGAEYSSGSLAAIILMFGMIFSGVGGIIINYLAGVGKPVYGVYLTVLNIIFILIFGFLLVPSLEINGAAITRTIAALVGISFLIYAFILNTKVSFKELIIKKSDFKLYYSFLKRALVLVKQKV